LNAKKTNKKIKFGVIGLTRGMDFARIIDENQLTKLVAVCEYDNSRIDEFLSWKKDAKVYNDFNNFLEHDMDAVIICGYLNDHAYQAIQALKSGKHVLCEVTACKTLAEGVALCRAVEESDKIYMYAENYCYFSYIQEMEKLYNEQVIGEYLYGDCEYIHKLSLEENAIIANSPNHWRNWLPVTYYCTHALGPVLRITKTRPVKVNGFVVPNKVNRTLGKKTDDVGLLICTMDNGAITRVIPCATLTHKPYSLWYSIYGTKGTMENNRFRPQQVIHITVDGDSYTDFDKSYQPKFSKHYNRKLMVHGGSDFFMVNDFLDAIINRSPSPIDVYMAMDMTLPGIIGYRSAINGNVPLDIPDFRYEQIRKKYEDDKWSPDPADKNIPNQPESSVLGEIRIPDSIYKTMEKIRKESKVSHEEVRRIFED